jgi:hypothetical protein
VTKAREFDLNIERVLENWTVAHAIREVIANALDEAALSATPEPEIGKDGLARRPAGFSARAALLIGRSAPP